MKRLFAITTIALACSASIASGRLLDPWSPKHPILEKSLVDKVDSKGIDVSRRWGHSSQLPGERPILAPLQGFTSAVEAETAKADWMKDFEGEIHSVLVGTRNTQQMFGGFNQAPLDLGTFRYEWEKSDPSQRVFISFTRADTEHAVAVKQALDDLGYTTFIYRGEAQGGPLVTSEEAGYFFATAENHFVIDTKNARRNSGVWFEKELLGRYGGPSDVDIVPKKPRGVPPAPPPVPSAPPPVSPAPPPSGGGRRVINCICNIYRNGVLVSSYPILPGARCGGQVCGDGPQTSVGHIARSFQVQGIESSFALCVPVFFK